MAKRPWSVAPLEGKYYGTLVVDREGTVVARFWDHDHYGSPQQKELSVREIASWGRTPTEEDIRDAKVDGHWECEADYAQAVHLCHLVNGSDPF